MEPLPETDPPPTHSGGNEHHGASLARGVAVLACAYVVSGALSSALVLPGGLWPVRLSSGIAFAALLIHGVRLWPGIWVGSATFSALWVLLAPNEISWMRMLVVTPLIAVVTSVEAVVGAALTRRGVPDLELLDTPRALVHLVLGAFASCLLGAGLGIPVLWGLNLLASNDVGVSFGSWFMRDLAAILIVTPLALAWHLQSVGSLRRYLRILVAPVAVCLSLVIGVAAYVIDLGAAQERRDFAQRAQNTSHSIQKGFEAAETALNSLAALYAASEEVERDEFQVFGSELMAHLPGVWALEWVPRVPRVERVAFERRARARGLVGFSITDPVPGGGRVPSPPREEHFPVLYIVPENASAAPLGFDIASSPGGHAALLEARDSGLTVATGRLGPVEPGSGSHTFLLLHPIYREPSVPPTPAGRREQLAGHVLAVVRFPEIMSHALAGMDTEGVAYELVDLDAPGESALLHAGGDALHRDRATLSWSREFEVGQRRWSLALRRDSPARSFLRFWIPWAIISTGAVLTGMLGLLLISIVGRTARVERLVRDRTAELEAASANLRQMTVIDPLTELLNRRGIEEKLVRMTRRTEVMAVLIDLDDFKSINDTYGHSAGDAVLAGTAGAIAGALRPTDLVARIGGDEFLAILPNSPLLAATSIAERIRGAVEKLRFDEIPDDATPTVSLGAGAVPPGTESVTELLKQLGSSLRASKRGGKNRLSLAEP